MESAPWRLCAAERMLPAGSLMCAVLFISSDAATRERWVRAFQAHGREAVAAAPGSDALTYAARPLEAVVVDVDLAVDRQYCRMLSKQRLAAPLIALTSWSAPNSRYPRLAFRAGCQALIAKPCSADALLEVIERLASGERYIEITVPR